ncbi:hypothetical protein [Erwinia sp. 9145]|uniref:hypothetical protein n=1 Tax=Erwinia sp. 9145 TaxID=1500895 RepID=UPI000A715335|nr:hypothetical protein [Erwinia sp. 9145]
MDMEETQAAVAQVIGEAALQVLAEGRELSNETVRNMVLLLAEAVPDLSVEFALDLLR